MPTYDFWLKIRLFGPFCLGAVNRFFSIFSRYFFRRKCYLRPLQHLAFLIKILSTELPSTPEYFSIVLSTGPPLGGECSIQLSYDDTLTYIKYIKLFFFFCQAYRQSTSPCSQRIPLNLRPTLGSPIKSSFAIVNSI